LHGHLAEQLRSSLSKGHPPNPRGTCGNLGETRGGVGKSGVLEHKSGNISETHKDRGKVTMERLSEVTNALSNGTIPDPLRASPSPRLGVRNHTPKLQSLLSQERIKLGTLNMAGIFKASTRTQAHEKIWRKGSVDVSRDGPSFWSTPYYLRNG